MACLEPMLRRRQLLAASATTIPIFLALTACAGHPDPLDGPPPLSADVRGLLDAVTAESNLILVYNETLSRYSALAPALNPLLAEHRSHLDRLRGRIIEPPGKSVNTGATVRPRVPGSERSAVTQLLSAERSAGSAQLRRLGTAAPDLAQLYASIAASESTHAEVLARLA
jgi:hypothetical protein